LRLFRRRCLRLVFYFAGTFAGLVRTLVDHLLGAVLDLAAGNHSAQARWPPQPGAAALPIAISESQESEDREQVTRHTRAFGREQENGVRREAFSSG